MNRKLMMLLAALAAGYGIHVNAADEKRVPPTPEEKAAVFTKKDKDGDGKLTKEEFLGKAKEEQKPKLETAFGRLDKDTDGSLTKDEFLGTAAGRGKGKGKKNE
jgi:hypothetical protein